MKHKKHHEDNFKKEYENKFDDYRDIDEEEIKNYIKKKLGEFPNHKLLQELSLNVLLWVFDAVSFYPNCMSDEKSNYPRIETGYAYTPNMNEELVNKFNNQTFTKGFAILKIKYYNPKNRIVQHLPVKEKKKAVEINCMRNGYIIHYLTSVDFQESLKIGEKVVEVYESVFYRANFKISPFKKTIDKLFELRQKYKDEISDAMQLLVKLIMNSSYGEQIRKDIEESYQCKSEMWMMTEYDERVLDYQKINYGNYIVELKDDEGLEIIS